MFIVVAAAALEATAADMPFRIVAFGDSTTALRSDVKAVYAQIISQELTRQGLSAEVVNAGVGSNTTALAVARLKRDVLDRKPQLVIVQFGLNDAAVDVHEHPPASAPRVALMEFRRNLCAIVDQIATHSGRTILMTPNPMCWTAEMRKMYGKPPYDPSDPQGFNIVLTDYVQAVREIAREKHVPLIDAYDVFQKYARGPGRTLNDLLPDGVHPNDQGHRMIADLLIPQITRLTGHDAK